MTFLIIEGILYLRFVHVVLMGSVCLLRYYFSDGFKFVATPSGLGEWMDV